MIDRKFRFHDDPQDVSNWCGVCGLYYCWHPECEGHKNNFDADHTFVPNTKPLSEADPQLEENLD